MKRFRYLILMLIASMDILCLIRLINLVIPFGGKTSDIIMYLTIVLIIAAFLAAGIFCAASKVTDTQKSVTIHSSVYRVFNIVNFALFVVYFIIFVIITSDMNRGSDEYIIKMLPGFIPVIAGALSNIISRI